jgi:hypothetical protein
MFSIHFELQFVIRKHKPSRKMFFAIEIYYLQLKPIELMSINQ